MNPADITPLILTYNEAPNIGDTLERLRWARQVVLVDSYSTDATVDIASRFENVVVVQRRFDHFADQCNFGLRRVTTEWTLSLDADYKCPAQLPDELVTLPDKPFNGYRASFRYCVNGRPLRGCLYPSRVVLYRTSLARYVRDGHAHRVQISGDIGKLKSFILHDDRKPLADWFASQRKYAELEARKLRETPRSRLGRLDRLRRWYVVAPCATLLYCLFVKRLLWDGRAGLHYTLQRVYAELLLGMTLLDRSLRPRGERAARLPGEPTSDAISPTEAETHELSYPGN